MQSWSDESRGGGANGFIGRELSVALVEAKYDVFALSRRAPEIAGATGRSVDVADGVSLQNAIMVSTIPKNRSIRPTPAG